MQPDLTYLFFDMNSFFASVEQNEDPALLGKPVGVITTDSPTAACIALSYEAKAFGLKMGARQAEARMICPEIVYRPARHDVYVDYHHRIRAAVDQVLPIKQAHSVDEFSCLLMGRQRELSTALEIAAEVQAVILREVGPAMRCSVGVAPSVLLAKIAAEMKKPAGINWLHPDMLPGKIAHIPLEDIPGVSKGMLARLGQAGIRDVPSLYALDPKHARKIWSSVVGEKVLRALHGEEVDWAQESGKSIGHGQRLSGPNKSVEGARLVARRLVVKAGARLRREGKFAQALSFSVKTEDGNAYRGGKDVAATQDTFVLLDAFNALWGELHLSPPVTSVSIMLGGLRQLHELSADFFTPRPMDGPTARENLCHALDGLNHRYGQNTVRFGNLPPYSLPYTGAKIAFNRVPDAADFVE